MTLGLFKINPFFLFKMKFRAIDTSNLKLIHCGKECTLPLHTCTDTEILLFLERKEHYIYWFQPNDSSAPKDQIPALKHKDAFYSLSLRTMKSVWRHVRLRKNFQNIERAHSGGYKLKIPIALWTEKKRTQYRFQVFRSTI